MKFEIEELPIDGTIAAKCHEVKDGYTGSGFIKVKPTNCILPKHFKNCIEEIRNFEVRNDDLFLVSNPKCGTTWCMEMVWMIANDLDFETAKINQEMRFPHIDVHGCVTKDLQMKMMGRTVYEAISSKPSPRFIKSHLPKDLLPVQIWTKKPKLVFIVRNPKDAAISNFHHYRVFHNYKGTLEEFLEATLEEKVMYSPFWDQVIEFWKMRTEPNVLFLTFEDMKKDLKSVMKKTADFLGKNLTEEQYQLLSDHLAFQNMKKNKAVNYDEVKEVLKDIQPTGQGSFIREGGSGGWQSKMSLEISKKFDEWTRKKISGTGLEELYGS